MTPPRRTPLPIGPSRLSSGFPAADQDHQAGDGWTSPTNRRLCPHRSGNVTAGNGS